jgi:hypothetical protein
MREKNDGGDDAAPPHTMITQKFKNGPFSCPSLFANTKLA